MADPRNEGLDPMGDRRPGGASRDDLTGREAMGDRVHRDDADAPVDGEAVGGVSGLAAGAAIGAVTGGPVGAVIGAAAGAIAGVGIAKGVDYAVNHDEEEKYWSETYATRPYAKADRGYEHYRPAYRYGWESRTRFSADRRFDDVEPDLERGWNDYRGTSGLGWSDAREATRDAWNRIERRVRDV